MLNKISRSQIQQIYNEYITAGVEEWDAKKYVIETVLAGDMEFLKPGSPEYYFTIQAVWNMCNAA